MSDLILLDLEENLMTGSAFPETVFDLTSLIAYRISNNFFTGSITSQIGEMQDLERKSLNSSHGQKTVAIAF